MKVCICSDVNEDEILHNIAEGCSVDDICDKLNIGNRCGICIDEIKRIIDQLDDKYNCMA
jgi:bacterioferritin-associated ferredoxin